MSVKDNLSGLKEKNPLNVKNTVRGLFMSGTAFISAGRFLTETSFSEMKTHGEKVLRALYPVYIFRNRMC